MWAAPELAEFGEISSTATAVSSQLGVGGRDKSFHP
jgi:hypothetical protein